MKKPVIAFIGAGNMASSLIGGLIADEYPSNNIWATNINTDKLNRLRDCFQIHVTDDNREAVQHADVVVLCVKPTALKAVLEELKESINQKKPLLISIVTGVRLDTIQKWTHSKDLSIVRSMPNTPALLRCGVTGLCANPFVSKEQHAIAESIMRSVGVTLWLENEDDLDAVTAVSGSGPAYFFLVMEAMLDCAKQMGLSDEHAQLLTINTALGASRMALESGKSVGALRKQVTSPGGTTEQAIEVLEAGGLRKLFLNALEAARAKALEMSKLLD